MKKALFAVLVVAFVLRFAASALAVPPSVMTTDPVDGSAAWRVQFTYQDLQDAAAKNEGGYNAFTGTGHVTTQIDNAGVVDNTPRSRRPRTTSTPTRRTAATTPPRTSARCVTPSTVQRVRTTCFVPTARTTRARTATSAVRALDQGRLRPEPGRHLHHQRPHHRRPDPDPGQHRPPVRAARHALDDGCQRRPAGAGDRGPCVRPGEELRCTASAVTTARATRAPAAAATPRSARWPFAA